MTVKQKMSVYVQYCGYFAPTVTDDL